ncbi:efflux RND transporter periplasmic adaptor subunit [Malikia spinosa]|jgi:RND family efflux transporter MFP subunit|uniref:Efflux RND transporter periplasmic adaptor subunit n=2 Tax=Malikia spinosa TaxID=86180 RepID=A0A2S9KF43_9BURK|nr:efflux RND transporter periplasmic adaptor subunit [Malikia spinosa]MYZ52248.1 efflux RND transporter periplasmic adaptor subunit [Malikia spinosa]PRD69022.1 hypothetical protein C6P61_08040 [Malikia spinosa]
MKHSMNLMTEKRSSYRALQRFALAVLCGAILPGASSRAAEFVGIVYPKHDHMLSVHMAGVVDRLHVKLGQRVKAGQPIFSQDVRLQQTEQQRRLVILNDIAEQRATEQRRAILEDLVTDATFLYETAGTVSREELLKLRMELEATSGRSGQLQAAKKREQTELEIAEREYEMRVLRAPISGVVTMLKVRQGEWAAPGDALVRLVDDTDCELRVNISQTAARKLSAGAPVTVHLEDAAVPGPQAGRVIFVAPVIDAASALVEVRVKIPNRERRIRPGVKARLVMDGVS